MEEEGGFVRRSAMAVDRVPMEQVTNLVRGKQPSTAAASPAMSGKARPLSKAAAAAAASGAGAKAKAAASGAGAKAKAKAAASGAGAKAKGELPCVGSEAASKLRAELVEKRRDSLRHKYRTCSGTKPVYAPLDSDEFLAMFSPDAREEYQAGIAFLQEAFKKEEKEADAAFDALCSRVML